MIHSMQKSGFAHVHRMAALLSQRYQSKAFCMHIAYADKRQSNQSVLFPIDDIWL